MPVGPTRIKAPEADGWRWTTALLQPTGAKLWRFAYRFGGKQKLLAIGVYPTIPLARARQAREDARRLLADGLDPAVEKKRKAEAQAGAPTFHGVADEYIAKLRRENRSEATIAKTEWLLSFANAAFGDEPVGQIAAPAILKVLQSLEARGRYESARRLRSTIGSVFRACARIIAQPERLKMNPVGGYVGRALGRDEGDRLARENFSCSGRAPFGPLYVLGGR